MRRVRRGGRRPASRVNGDFGRPSANAATNERDDCDHHAADAAARRRRRTSVTDASIERDGQTDTDQVEVVRQPAQRPEQVGVPARRADRSVDEGNHGQADRDHPRRRCERRGELSPTSTGISTMVEHEGQQQRAGAEAGQGSADAAEEHQRRQQSTAARPARAALPWRTAIVNAQPTYVAGIHASPRPLVRGVRRGIAGRRRRRPGRSARDGEVEPGEQRRRATRPPTCCRQWPHAGSAGRRRRLRRSHRRATAIASLTSLPRVPTILACYPRHLVSPARRWVRQLLALTGQDRGDRWPSLPAWCGGSGRRSPATTSAPMSCC